MEESWWSEIGALFTNLLLEVLTSVDLIGEPALGMRKHVPKAQQKYECSA